MFPDIPKDPFSTTYRKWVLTSFELVRGAAYDVNTEGLPVNVEWEVLNAFPYGTRDPNIIGSYLITYGWIIRELALKPHARILEIGAGLGSLTWPLARAGYNVTSVEINKKNAEVTRRITEKLAYPAQVICEDIMRLEPTGTFDCVLFFEAFHHMLDHDDLLRRCKSWLAPGGKIMFAAEPVLDDYPYPWGLRTDGSSLRAIALWGWLELGFRRAYFEELLRRHGLKFRYARSDAAHWCKAYIATT